RSTRRRRGRSGASARATAATRRARTRRPRTGRRKRGGRCRPSRTPSSRDLGPRTRPSGRSTAVARRGEKSNAPPREPRLPVRAPIRNLRFWILALLFASTLVNYVDRQVLSVLKPTLEKLFDWDAQRYAALLLAWQSAYAIGQFGSGWLFDRIGT